jgi:hypothetical protein
MALEPERAGIQIRVDSARLREAMAGSDRKG